MKKITLLFFALFAILWQSSGQVQVGNGTTTTTSLPLWSCWGYTYSQQIYYQSEVNAQGDITSLSFYYASGPNTNSLDWTIYMGHTTKTEFTSNTDWEPLASLTQVYTGTVTFPAAGNWMQITLDTPFSYNNVDNLIIALDENQAGFNCSVNWQKTDTPVNRGIAYRNDTTNPDPASPPTATSIFTYYPNVILDGIQQACPNPSALAAGNITPNSAELSWTENGTATTWNIEVVTAGSTPTGTATDVATTNPFVVTGLSPATDYEYYVQADCGLGEQSGWIGPFSFTTECTVFTAPYAEGFDTIGSIPNCWSQGASNNENWLFTSPTASHIGNVGNFGGTTTATGGGFAWVDDSTPDNLGTTLVSPLVDITSLSTPTLSFYTISHNEGQTNVSFSVDFFDGATWNTAVYTSNTNTAGWEQVFIDLSTFTITGPVQARFVVDENNPAGQFYDDRAIDDVKFDDAPTCFNPTDITVVSVTDVTAQVSWTENGTAASWNIEVVAAGSTPTGTPTHVAGTNPYTINGLTELTAYDFYIQADCGAGDTSDWIGPLGFTTACSVFVAPYSQDFENAGSIPSCWNQGASNSESWLFSQATSGNHVGNAGNFSGTLSSSGGYYAFVDDSTPDNLGTTLVSPLIDVSGLTSPTLSFYTISHNEGFSNVSFSVDFFDGATWNLGVYSSNSNTAGWEQIFIDLSTFTITGPVQARFIVDEDNTSGDFYDDRAIDDVVFDEAPSCFNPTDLTVITATFTTADVSWTDINGATSWNIEYGPSGFAPGTGTVVNGVTNPYTIPGLTADTQYDFYVQTDCGAGDLSEWVGPQTFLTGYCSSVPTSFDGQGVTNVQIVSTDFPSLGAVSYEDHTTTPVDAYQAIMTNLQVSFATGFTYNTNVWIDFNDNFEFETSELVFSGESLATNPTTLDASFLMPLTAPLGTHRMRIGTADGGQATPNPCYSGAWGVTLDFTININPAPACIPPSDLAVVSTSMSTADFSWTENNAGVTTWNIEYGPDGFTPGTGTIVTATSDNPFEATGLTVDTDYDFYVQSDCGATDGVSLWSGPFSFFHGYCPSVPTSNDGQGVTNVTVGSTDFTSLGDVTYEDHTATSVNLFQNVNVNLLITFATGFTYDTNVWIDFNDNMAFEASELVFSGTSLAANPTTLDASFLMDVAAPLGTHRMRIGTADAGQVPPNPCYNGAWGVTLDFTIVINPEPSCLPPSGLSVASTSYSTADFSWTENNPGVTTWNVEYGPDGFTPGTGTIVTGTSDNPLEATGLTVDTDYDFYVQSDCGAADGVSVWSGPFSFFHGYCTSVPTSNDGNGVANVQLNTAQFPSLGDVTYENHTATVVNIFQGLNIPLFVTFETGFTYDTNVWIDFNDDLLFDASEIVFSGTSAATNPTTLDASFLLDVAAPLGIHRMRIGTADAGQVPPNPCYNGAWGVTLDFTVNIVELTCDLFEAEYTVIDDCANGDQFLIEVEITDMGSATSLTIANNIDATTVPVSGLGTYIAGPFPFMQNVYLSVSNDQDNNCTLLSPTYNLLGCPPANDDCVNSIEATVNLDDECTILNPGTILGASPSNEPAGTCTGAPNDDVWFHFVAENDTQIIQLLNISGTTTNLDFAVYDGTCGAFTEVLCTTETTEIVSDLTVGNTYYVRVFSGGSGSYTTTFDLCIKYHGGVVTVTQNVDEFPSEQEWVEDLVENVLLSSACAQVSNITYSTGTNFGSENGIGYFTTNSQTFPFADGIVLATANAVDMTGPKGGPINGGAFDWPGDTDLFNYIDGLGIDPGLSDYNNATILEFDFVPYNNEMSFDFLFASDEYGTFQCDYSDAFAFFLTDVNTGVTTNLAIVPGTNDPISVITIRDNAYNSGCSSVNDQYFDAYYGFGGEDPIVAPINLNGTTVQMTAESPVIPYNNYHIKLVIADRNDTAFDSAVFLSGGSFEIGEPDLGLDITIADGTATCYGNVVTLDTGYQGVPHTWYFEGFEIPGETGSTIDITEQGTYAVQLVYSPTCAPYDEILVEFLPLPEIVAEPIDVQSCDDSGTGTYDLTANNDSILGPDQDPNDYTITIHPTEQDAMDNTAEMASPYTGAPQTVFIRIEDNATSCYNIASFDLVFYPNPTFTQPGDLGGCDSDLDGFGEFFLTDQDALILNGQTGLAITYHASQADADSGTAPLAVPYVALPGMVYVRIEDTTTGCYSTTSYNLVLNANPTVVTPDDMEACSDDDGYASYDLESQTALITGGNANYVVTYHESGTNAIAGINALSSPYETIPTQTIYVRVEDTATGCYTITDFDLIAYPYEDPSFDYGNINLLPCYEVPSAIIYGEQGGVFTIEVGVDSSVSIDAATGQIINGASGASYVVTYTTTGPCPQSSSMTVDFEQCVFPQAISPNGDGLNDNFDLSSFDVQKLEVFNRYGALVYSKTDYTNEWHGQSDSGDELPVGTYYYVIRYQSGKEKAAWVYINK